MDTRPDPDRPDLNRLDPPWRRAAEFAARAHQGQSRRDGVTPYFAHPVRVAMTVRDVFGCDDPDVLSAAFLHDTIEDTGADYEDVAGLVGERAAALVVAMTKDMRLPEPVREPAYDAQLRDAEWGARLIKLADAYDNLLDCEPGEKLARAVDKAARAVELARVDDHPASRRGVEVLGALVGTIGLA